jgi:probable phosphoglycerate mutase
VTEQVPEAQPQTRILVVRHGQSEGNVAGVWTSARTGFPLTDLGHEQARGLGWSLVDCGASALYASPILRANETAAEIGEVLGLPVLTLEGVEEMHVGVHEGAHDDTIGPIALDVFGRWWRDGDLSARFEGGETGHEIASRMRASLEKVVAEHPGETVVVVSHGGVMAVALTEMSDNLDAAFVSEHILANCEVVTVTHDDGSWHCDTWAGITL